jgi:hypothetical protein
VPVTNLAADTTLGWALELPGRPRKGDAPAQPQPQFPPDAATGASKADGGKAGTVSHMPPEAHRPRRGGFHNTVIEGTTWEPQWWDARPHGQLMVMAG